jgi:hypothetical protein
LENKEMQIIKLEKLMKQMERQEEHSQVQRTRLENRIAKLEIALKEGQQAHRYVNPKTLQAIGIQNYEIEDILNRPSPVKSTDLYTFQSKLAPLCQRDNACPDYAQLKTEKQMFVNTYSCTVPERKYQNLKLGHKLQSYVEKDYTSKGLCKKIKAKRNNESSKRGFPIYKWLLKPFVRESSSQHVHKHHANYGEPSKDTGNRHYGKKLIRTMNESFRETSHFVCSSGHYT